MTTNTPPGDGFDPADPIIAAWASQVEPEDGASYLPQDPSTLVDSVAKAHRKDQRRLFWLNVREVVPTPFIAGFFAFGATDAVRPVAVLVAAAIVLTPGSFLLVRSIRHHRADARWGTSVREQLARRLAQVEHAAWLLRNVGWWYFLPFTVAIFLFLWGLGDLSEDLSFLFTFSAGYAAFTVVMYLVNRWIGRKKYEPEVERFQVLLADFDRTA